MANMRFIYLILQVNTDLLYCAKLLLYIAQVPLLLPKYFMVGNP